MGLKCGRSNRPRHVVPTRGVTIDDPKSFTVLLNSLVSKRMTLVRVMGIAAGLADTGCVNQAAGRGFGGYL